MTPEAVGEIRHSARRATVGRSKCTPSTALVTSSMRLGSQLSQLVPAERVGFFQVHVLAEERARCDRIQVATDPVRLRRARQQFAVKKLDEACRRLARGGGARVQAITPPWIA